MELTESIREKIEELRKKKRARHDTFLAQMNEDYLRQREYAKELSTQWQNKVLSYRPEETGDDGVETVAVREQKVGDGEHGTEREEESLDGYMDVPPEKNTEEKEETEKPPIETPMPEIDPTGGRDSCSNRAVPVRSSSVGADLATRPFREVSALRATSVAVLKTLDRINARREVVRRDYQDTLMDLDRLERRLVRISSKFEKATRSGEEEFIQLMEEGADSAEKKRKASVAWDESEEEADEESCNEEERSKIYKKPRTEVKELRTRSVLVRTAEFVASACLGVGMAWAIPEVINGIVEVRSLPISFLSK